jgi:uncharacterized protein (TIGR02145 family)
VNDPRGLAPLGYHIPTDAEWTTLTTTLGGLSLAGAKMKSTSRWYNNGNGTNSSGFAGLPGGYRCNYCSVGTGSFTSIGKCGVWWSSSEDDDFARFAKYVLLSYGYSGLNVNSEEKADGFSVRCLRD